MEDDIAKVDVRYNATSEPTAYKKDPWMIVDVPGIMGDEILEVAAFEEAIASTVSGFLPIAQLLATPGILGVWSTCFSV